MTREFKGDLLKFARDGYFDAIIHGCNCFCTMGSGIAKQIREEHPEAYEADCETERGDITKLGNFTYADTLDTTHHQFRIINAYTQFRYDAKLKPLDYDALTLVLRKINHVYRGTAVGLPMIGAGLAGGNWNRIKKIIEHELNAMPVTIVYYQQS